jgi:hypothetical protein
VEVNLFIFGLVCYICPCSQKINILTAYYKRIFNEQGVFQDLLRGRESRKWCSLSTEWKYFSAATQISVDRGKTRIAERFGLRNAVLEQHFLSVVTRPVALPGFGDLGSISPTFYAQLLHT